MIIRGKLLPNGRVRFFNPDISIIWSTAANLGTITPNTLYSLTLSAVTGTGRTPTYSVVSGTLPAGLSLSGNKITGTPTTATTAAFTIRATYGRSFVDRAFSLVIASSDPTWGSFTQLQRINGVKTGTSSDGTTTSSFYFGGAVGLSTTGTWAIVGSRYYQQTFVYQKSGSTWTQNSVIPAGQGSGSGGHVQISENGLVAAIQVLATKNSNGGQVYVYWRASTSSNWTNTNRTLINVTGDISETFSMSRDGSIWAVIEGGDRAYLIMPPPSNGNVWPGSTSAGIAVQTWTVPSGKVYNRSEISRDGLTAAAMGPNFVQIYTRNFVTAGFNLAQTITPSFGSGVDASCAEVGVSDDGTYIALTNKFAQGVRYTRSGNTWGNQTFLTQTVLTPNNASAGISGGITSKTIQVSKGGVVAIGATDTLEGSVNAAGRVFMFDNTGTFRSSIRAADAATNGYFGNKMSMSADGNILLVGSQIANNSTGKVYFFKPND